MNNKVEKKLRQEKAFAEFYYSDSVVKTLSLRFSAKDVLNYIIAYDNMYGTIYVSQDRIAAFLGISREHVNRIIAYLCELGLLGKIYRHFQTCLYYLPKFLKDFEVRETLRSVYSACKYLPISVLMSLGDEMKCLSSMIGVNQFNNTPYIEVLENSREDRSRANVSHNKYNNKDYVNNTTTTSHVLEKSSRGREARTGVGHDRKYIKGLNLTDAGAIKLMAYPKEAFDYALESLQKSTVPIKQPFILFSKICFNYCREKGLFADHGFVFSELRRRGLDKDSPGVDLQNPYIYYTSEEYRAMQPKTKRVPDQKYGGHSPQDTAAPPVRELDIKHEAQRAIEILASGPANTGDPFYDDIIIKLLSDTIKKAQ